MGLLLCRGIVLGPIVEVLPHGSFLRLLVWSSSCRNHAGSGDAGRLVGAGGVLVLLEQRLRLLSKLLLRRGFNGVPVSVLCRCECRYGVSECVVLGGWRRGGDS